MARGRRSSGGAARHTRPETDGPGRFLRPGPRTHRGLAQELPVDRLTPIAITGLAVRLPGADSLEQFWELLRDGRHGIQRQDRWDDSLTDPDLLAPGKIISDRLGQID